MPATTYSPFWGPSVDAYTILVNKMPRRYAIKRVVNRDGFRVASELFDTLIGAAAGSTAAASHARVGSASVVSTTGTTQLDPGKPVIETVTDINRVTTATDITALKEMVFGVRTRPAYPRDLSGNGGGALA